MRVVEKKISNGDDYASLIYEVMAYQIAPVTVYPGEDEIEALNLSGLGVLRGEEEAKEY